MNIGLEEKEIVEFSQSNTKVNWTTGLVCSMEFKPNLVHSL